MTELEPNEFQEGNIPSSEESTSAGLFAVPEGHKSAFIAIVGKPNAGKSTLMNALVGSRLSIVTPKAQTTRHRIAGMLNKDMYQLVFFDTPGVMNPKYKLQEYMIEAARKALDEADIVMLLAAANEHFPEDGLIEMLKSVKSPIVLVMNKIDAVSKEVTQQRLDWFKEQLPIAAAMPISALHGMHLMELEELLVKLAPEGPAYYDKDELSDRTLRFFASEIIREKIFLLLEEEIPYGTQVEIMLFEERDDLTYIDAEIHVEKVSHKPIVIGRKGVMIQQIGTMARLDLQKFLERKVFLNLYVRITEGWKDQERRLRSFGYKN